MARLYEEDQMTQMRKGAARRALAPEAAPAEEAMPTPPAASATPIRHEGFGGYTYSFDPNTQELTILEDPTGRVPAGYVVPKGTGPYEAILGEMIEADLDTRGVDKPMEEMAEEEGEDVLADVRTRASEAPITSALEKRRLGRTDLGDMATAVSLEGAEVPDPADVDTPYADMRMGGVPDPGDVDTPYADRRMAGVPDPSAVATPYAEARMAGGMLEDDDESLEGLEAQLENLRAKISDKRKAVRERVRQRRGAEATAPPSAGGAQTQAPAMTGGGGVSYEGM